MRKPDNETPPSTPIVAGGCRRGERAGLANAMRWRISSPISPGAPCLSLAVRCRRAGQPPHLARQTTALATSAAPRRGPGRGSRLQISPFRYPLLPLRGRRRSSPQHFSLRGLSLGCRLHPSSADPHEGELSDSTTSTPGSAQPAGMVCRCCICFLGCSSSPQALAHLLPLRTSDHSHRSRTVLCVSPRRCCAIGCPPGRDGRQRLLRYPRLVPLARGGAQACGAYLPSWQLADAVGGSAR